MVAVLAAVGAQGTQPALASLHDLFQSFTPLDWLLAGIAAWSVVRGLIRGFILELFGLAGVIVSFMVAAWNYPAVALELSRWITTPLYAEAVAFGLLALGCGLSVLLLGRVVRSAARLAGLGLLDRLGGALFGLARATVLDAAIVVAVTAFLTPMPAVRDSRLAPELLRLAHATSFAVPVELQERVRSGLERLHR